MYPGKLASIVSLVLTAVAVFSPPALAGPNTGGVLVVHANTSIVYTTSTADYCGQSGLTDCAQATASVPWEAGTPTVFFVVAAFPDTAQPRLKALSWGVDWDDAKLVLLAHGSCADFDLPDGGWPASGKGIGQSFLEARTGLLNDLYWFAGYAYGAEADSTSFALTPHPLHGGQLVDDAVPAEVDSITGYGALGFGMAGHLVCSEGIVDGGDSGSEGSGGPEADGAGPEDAEGEPESDGGGYPPTGGDALAFVELVPAADSTFTQNLRGLEDDYGLRILVSIIPDIVICFASDDQLQRLASDQRVTTATKSAVSGASTIAANTIEPGQPGLGPTIWNYLLNPAQPETTSYSFPYACGLSPDSSRGDILPEQDQNRQTSVFMMGKVGLSLVFLESQDSRTCSAPDYTENWTLAERTQVLAEATQGLTTESLQNPGLREIDLRAQLTFEIYDFVIAPTSVEPIRGTHDSETWGREALAYMGYGSGDLKTRAYALNNDRRRSPRAPG